MGGCSSTVSPESTTDVKVEKNSDAKACGCCQGYEFHSNRKALHSLLAVDNST